MAPTKDGHIATDKTETQHQTNCSCIYNAGKDTIDNNNNYTFYVDSMAEQENVTIASKHFTTSITACDDCPINTGSVKFVVLVLVAIVLVLVICCSCYKRFCKIKGKSFDSTLLAEPVETAKTEPDELPSILKEMNTVSSIGTAQSVDERSERSAKSVKSVKYGKSVKYSKSKKSAKSAKSTKSAKTLSPAKSVKSVSPAKSVKSGRPAKSAKSGRPAKSVKSMRRAKSVKSARRTKLVKTPKTVSPGKKSGTRKAEKNFVTRTPSPLPLPLQPGAKLEDKGSTGTDYYAEIAPKGVKSFSQYEIMRRKKTSK